MAVKLRLVRMGKKKQPTYRIVAADSRRARGGAFLEIVGTYQPRGLSAAKPEMVFSIDNDKCVQWLRNGAQPTERVAKLLKASGAMDAFAGTTPSEGATPSTAPTSTPVVTEALDDGPSDAEESHVEATS